MWLGELFTELGCQTVPALHCRQAQIFANRLTMPVGILVVNPELRGAQRTIKALMAANPGLRLVLIRDAGSEGSFHAADRSGIQLGVTMGDRARSLLERPSPGQSVSREEWLARIRRTISAAADKAQNPSSADRPYQRDKAPD